MVLCATLPRDSIAEIRDTLYKIPRVSASHFCLYPIHYTHMDTLRLLEEKVQKALAHTQLELQSIRAGRAHPSVLENITVEAYGGERMPLKQLATITAPEPTLLLVQPWDRSVIAQVEKAIREQANGLNPSTDGPLVRVPLPALSIERREQLVKMARAKGEEGKITLRNIRHETLDTLKADELSEDEEARLKKEVQNQIDKATAAIDALIESKEKDLTTL